jgi:hypothetical protein
VFVKGMALQVPPSRLGNVGSRKSLTSATPLQLGAKQIDLWPEFANFVAKQF